MLRNDDIEKVETIICFPFTKKQLLVNLFNANKPYSQQAINNGQEIFKSLLQLVIANDKQINKQEQQEYYDDFLSRIGKNRYWVNQLNKLGLAKYLPNDDENKIDFVYCLIDAMDNDVAHDQHKLLTAFKKLIYYDHSLNNPLFMDYNELDWNYLLTSNYGKNLTLEITCPRFVTYHHQNLGELYSYLYYSYIDLFGKYADDDVNLKDIWTTINLNKNPINQFNQICTEHQLNVGTFFLKDQYYWYCVSFVGKFKYCFASKSEKKEDAKNASIMQFLTYYHDKNRMPLDLKDHNHKELASLFSHVQTQLGLPFVNEDELKKIAWAKVKATSLVHELNKNDFFTLCIYHYDKKQSNCTVCVTGCEQAFSANGSGETNAQAAANQLLINYCKDFNK